MWGERIKREVNWRVKIIKESKRRLSSLQSQYQLLNLLCLPLVYASDYQVADW